VIETLIRITPSSGLPIYVQLMEQIKHAVEICALMPGDQLPGIRTLAQQLVVSPNTIVKAYAELEYEGIIEIRHGSGAFIIDQERTPRKQSKLHQAKIEVHRLVAGLRSQGITEGEVRRLFEAELIVDDAQGSCSRAGGSRGK
jgi:GntR family transcriptional regulator